MLFSYKKIDHPILDFNEHINYFFRQMFNIIPREFDKDLLVKPEFWLLIDTSSKFKKYLSDLVEEFYMLPYGFQKDLEHAFSINNSTCLYSNTTLEPIKYEEIHKSIAPKLREFYDYLWNDYPQVNGIKDKYGIVKSHYDEITVGVYICPYCGIEVFKPSGGVHRENYDHILAKADYPFISMNLNFVVPTCRVCNMDEKKKKDTLYNIDGSRRKAYDPYDTTIGFDNLEVDIIPKEDFNNDNLTTLLSNIDWDYEIKRDSIQSEELGTWDDIYRIKGRYKEYTINTEIEWFNEVLRRFERSKRKRELFDEFKSEFIEDAKFAINSPLGIVKYSYFNFLLSVVDIEEKLNLTLAPI